jgi:hypothetical protein
MTSSLNAQSDSCNVNSLTSSLNASYDSYNIGSQTGYQNAQVDSCNENNPRSSPNAHVESPPWYDPYVNENTERISCLRKITANNRVAESAQLPTVAATNMRSILPKLRNFAEDMLQRQITVSLLSETWEKAEGNRKFQEETERLFELNGLKFLSYPRPSAHRGGGAAIVVDTRKFSCEKVEYPGAWKIGMCLGYSKAKSCKQGNSL